MRLPGFRPPRAVVAAYADQLAGKGFLWSFKDGHFYVPPEVLAKAAETRRRTWEARSRRSELALLAGALEESIGQGAAEIIARWTDAPLPGTDETPSQLADKGGDAWSDLSRALANLAKMTRPGGEPIAREKLLSLPLEELRQKRVAEAGRRETEHRVRSRRTVEAFLAQFRQEAETELGKDEAKAWLDARLGDVSSNLGSDDRLAPSSVFRRGLEADLRTAADRARAVRHAEADRMFARAQEEVRRDALRAKLLKAAQGKFREGGRAEIWMRSRHPGLGSSPLEACVDEGGLARCSRLLELAKRK